MITKCIQYYFSIGIKKFMHYKVVNYLNSNYFSSILVFTQNYANLIIEFIGSDNFI